MTEHEYEYALKALGAKNVTTERQKNNGTTAFKLPTGQTVTEHKTGYIRRTVRSGFNVQTCYQLNPTYDVNYQHIGVNGKLYKSTRKERTRIWSRKARLKKLFLYTTKKLNYGS